ncbi:MAG: hypothetical protein IKH89_03910 [Bacteroidales bacterium]|nr:hypothetical protein [Bacteroidales bacterium]
MLKLIYSAPKTAVFKVDVEGYIMDVSSGANWGDQGGAGGNDGYDDDNC